MWIVDKLLAQGCTADQKRGLVERFLRAYRHGARDYHDAFTGPDGKRLDGPTSPEILAILAKYTGQPAENVRLSITYADPEERLDVGEVLHQIAWYKAQGMVKPDVNGEDIVDKRYVLPLNEH